MCPLLGRSEEDMRAHKRYTTKMHYPRDVRDLPEPDIYREQALEQLRAEISESLDKDLAAIENHPIFLAKIKRDRHALRTWKIKDIYDRTTW